MKYKFLLVSLIPYVSKYFNKFLFITNRNLIISLACFKKKNIRCYYDNAYIASSVNILFICVLPSQLQLVIDDIKTSVLDKCIIYNFVRAETPLHLKNLLGEISPKTNIIKPTYLVNLKINDGPINWNYSLNMIECLSSDDIIEATNPFVNSEESILKTDAHFLSTMIYGFFNICHYLKLTQDQTIFAIKKFLFSSTKKNIKIEPTNFFELKSPLE